MRKSTRHHKAKVADLTSLQNPKRRFATSTQACSYQCHLRLWRSTRSLPETINKAIIKMPPRLWSFSTAVGDGNSICFMGPSNLKYGAQCCPFLGPATKIGGSSLTRYWKCKNPWAPGPAPLSFEAPLERISLKEGGGEGTGGGRRGGTWKHPVTLFSLLISSRD